MHNSMKNSNSVVPSNVVELHDRTCIFPDSFFLLLSPLRIYTSAAMLTVWVKISSYDENVSHNAHTITATHYDEKLFLYSCKKNNQVTT